MKKLFVLLLTFCSVCLLQAQKVNGDLSPLKGVAKVNVEFSYDGVTYDGDSEAEFFADNKDHDNFEQWKKDWKSRFRKEKWEANFLAKVNEEVGDLKVVFGTYPKADYTMKVKMVDIDPGSFAGPFSAPCKLTGEIRFVSKGSSDDFATMSFKKAQGNPYKMTPVIEDRVRFAFEDLGSNVGRVLKKKLE